MQIWSIDSTGDSQVISWSVCGALGVFDTHSSSNSEGSVMYRLTYLISRCCVSHLMINVIISFDLWWNSCSFVPPFIHFVIKPVLYLIWKFAFIRLSQNKRHVSCEQSSPDIKNHNRQHRSQVSHETNVRQRPESNSTQVCEPKRAVYCACALRPQPSVA